MESAIKQVAWMIFVAFIAWLFGDPRYLFLLVGMLFLLPTKPKRARLDDRLDRLADTLEDIRQNQNKNP